jgi:hypothetical protein
MAMAQNTSTGGAGVRIGSRRVPLPRSRLLRIAIGSVLILGGVFSFLPVLGVWMLPLGALVLSVDLPRVRRWRRRFAVWFSRKYPLTAARLHITGNGNNNNNARRPAER